MKLLSNIPIEDLTPENDYLGIIEKGDMVASLLKSGNIDFEEIKMFALYGNWGSGKSTLMKYLQKELKDEFNTFYFDAWQYENGRDLSYSLLEFMYEEGISDTEKTAEKMLDVAKRVLIGTAKGFTFKTPVVNFNTKELMNELEVQKEPTFHSKIKDFKREFEHFEGVLYQENGGKKKTNIVFIDDLDRCEPEKVLDLLSEIKLFFTYGVKTIFFFGVDQKAVEIAIRTRYRDVVKSNEYLEKVFDLTFQLREDLDVQKFIYTYFPKRTIENIGNGVSYQKYMFQFFQKLSLTNPRKLKKLINAYVIYSTYIYGKGINGKHQLIIDSENNGSFLITILTIYLIACRLFEPNQFELFGNVQKIRLSLENSIDSSLEAKKIETLKNNIVGIVNDSSYDSSIYHGLSEEVEYQRKQTQRINFYGFNRFGLMFTQDDTVNFKASALYDLKEFLNYYSVKQKSIGYNMMLYLYSHIHKSYDILKDDESTITPNEIKSYIKQYL